MAGGTGVEWGKIGVALFPRIDQGFLIGQSWSSERRRSGLENDFCCLFGRLFPVSGTGPRLRFGNSPPIHLAESVEITMIAVRVAF
ncbi:MAG TPA: hypothetical protein DDY91_15415 [Planctomycetaceae bacterium]|nr:hypothetical protein [Planctomycetaceae bacterium]